MDNFHKGAYVFVFGLCCIWWILSQIKDKLAEISNKLSITNESLQKEDVDKDFY